VRVRMRAIKAHIWKKLVEQAEIPEKSAKKFEPSVLKNKWGVNNKRCDATQSFQAKGKETMAVELSRETPTRSKRSSPNNNPSSNFLRNNTLLRMSRW